MPVMIICFVVLHKTMGRITVHFLRIISLLPASEKDKLPLTLSSFQSKHPSLLPAPQISFTRAAAKAFALCGCWERCQECQCVTAAGPPPAPNPSSAPVLLALTGTHLITMRTMKARAIPCNVPFEIKANRH